MTPQWPLPQHMKPRLDGFALRAPVLTRRTEFEDGEDRVRRTAHRKTYAQRATFELGLRALGALRRWVEEEIDHGRLWFQIAAFVDDRYVWVEARLIAEDGQLFEARAVDERTWSVSLNYEVRALPRMDDLAYAELILGGATPDLLDLFDLAINVELAEAAS